MSSPRSKVLAMHRLLLVAFCAVVGCGSPPDATTAEDGGAGDDAGTIASAKDITAFSILNVAGAVGPTTVTLTVPSGTDLTNLTPTITHDGASISPASGEAQDFTSPVTYAVTAADRSTKEYTVTVTTSQAGVIMDVDFEGQTVGDYTQSSTDWPNSQYFIGLSRCDIVADGAVGTRALQVTYPAGIVSPNNGGAQWITNLSQSYDELYLSFRVKFLDPDGAGPLAFEPTDGGKLPGLAGGSVPSGGTTAPSDGFSARMMWNDNFGLSQYMYYVDKIQPYGDVWPYRAGGLPGGTPFQFQVGVWYQIEHRIVMNTPGVDNGLVQGWVNGQLYVDKTADNDPGLFFRPAGATWGIDRFFFSTFYGGSGPAYQTSHDNKILFDDFIISTQPITH